MNMDFVFTVKVKNRNFLPYFEKIKTMSECLASSLLFVKV